jgi:hypothetical protein
VKWVKRFAIFPMDMSDGYTTVWLQFYWAKKRYFHGYSGANWETILRTENKPE